MLDLDQPGLESGSLTLFAQQQPTKNQSSERYSSSSLTEFRTAGEKSLYTILKVR
jgi:hypothetical protein